MSCEYFPANLRAVCRASALSSASRRASRNPAGLFFFSFAVALFSRLLSSRSLRALRFLPLADEVEAAAAGGIAAGGAAAGGVAAGGAAAGGVAGGVAAAGAAAGAAGGAGERAAGAAAGGAAGGALATAGAVASVPVHGGKMRRNLGSLMEHLQETEIQYSQEQPHESTKHGKKERRNTTLL